MNVKKGILVSIASAGVLGSLLIGSVAFAQTTSTTPPAGGWGGRGGHMMGRTPGVFGTVASVSGTTLTVTSKAGPNGTPASVTYTVDASTATVTKGGTASSVSAIADGDTVMIQGTVTGTSVVAKTIRDGILSKGTRPQNAPASTPAITGNGQPVIGGTVSSVSGNIITITTAQGGITYSVDATSATVQKGGVTSTVSSIVTGDRIVVQGTVNGTSVTATSVIDQGAAPSSTSTGTAGHGFGGDLMGGIRGFFQHLFGFF